MVASAFIVKNSLNVNGTLIYSGGILTIGNSTINVVSNSSQITIGQTKIANNTITVNKLVTFNGNTDLTVATSNATGASIAVRSSSVLDFYGNSTVKVANADSSGLTILKSKIQTVAFSANVQWDLANGNIGVLTLTANTVMPTPLNMSPGNYILHVYNDNVGGRSITSWTNTVYKWTAGQPPIGTTTANGHDLFSFTCDGTYMYGSFLPDVR